MAKSLRSKSKLAARNKRRFDPKSDYAVINAARVKKISERLLGGGGRQFKDGEDQDEDEQEEEETAEKNGEGSGQVKEGEEKMDVERES